MTKTRIRFPIGTFVLDHVTKEVAEVEFVDEKKLRYFIRNAKWGEFREEQQLHLSTIDLNGRSYILRD